MASEDGEVFIKNLAQFVRTHEKALANALQLHRQPAKNVAGKSGSPSSLPTKSTQSSLHAPSASSTLAAALSLGNPLNFTSQNIKTAKLTLTPHHLFYLLSRFEELDVDIGPLNVRVENLQSDSSPANYVSFLSQPPKSKGRSDRDSVHSVSSVRSVMSNMSSFWSSFGLGSNAAKDAKAHAQLQADLKYLYSAFTMIPCLRLSPDRKARLISGYEEFPFDTAVPLNAFKNVSALEICDLDFRSFFGWDKLADHLRSLTIKRGHLDDLMDLIVHIVLDDMDRRRRRSSSKNQYTPPGLWTSSTGPHLRQSDFVKLNTPPASPIVDDSRFGSSASPRNRHFLRGDSEISITRSPRQVRNKSLSPTRAANARPGSSYRYMRGSSDMLRRSGSGSSNSSTHSLTTTTTTSRNRSSSNLLSMGILPASKWRFLRHLCIADNGLTELTASGLSPLSNTLVSLDLSSNLFVEVPDCLAMLTGLRALNLSNCMIKSLHSLARNPLPAITALNLRANRLMSIAGIERLLSLERLDIRDNRILDPTEMARLTGIPDMREIWVYSNPFVKSHSNYRLTIFDLFRATPGYTEDLVIDNSGPGYSERRQLRGRVTESSPRPVKVQSLDFDIPLPVDQPSPGSNVEHNFLLSSNIQTHPSQSGDAAETGRRKKGPKRRIVDLSADDSSIGSKAFDDFEPRKRPYGASTDCSTTTDSTSLPSPIQRGPIMAHSPIISHTEPTRMAATHEPSTSPAVVQGTPLLHEVNHPDQQDLAVTHDLGQLSLGGDAYRQKVQALKDEYPGSWLRMLEEHNWQPSSESQIQNHPLSAAQTAVIHQNISSIRTQAQPIMSGNRTLG